MRTVKSFSKTESAQSRPLNRQPVPMQLGNDEATRRLVTASARRVIQQHRTELEALAYK